MCLLSILTLKNINFFQNCPFIFDSFYNKIYKTQKEYFKKL